MNEDEIYEIEASEWAYECALLEALDISDTERAEMAADEMAEAIEAEQANSLPIVTLPPKSAPWRTWTAAERGALALALREIGTSISEVSDARELIGLPRCSTAPPVRIEWTVRWAASAEGERLIRAVRAERSALAAELTHPTVAHHAATARLLLGLKSARPSAWRLGELRAAWAQTRLVEAYVNGASA